MAAMKRQRRMWPFSSYPSRNTRQLSPEYDYIILGGGTAGCVLARRLSEDTKSTVLLVERGDASDSLIELEHKSEAFERPTKLVTGIGLGGTSRINYMQYTRGAPGEYNAWSVSGRKGWSYKSFYHTSRKRNDSKSSAPHYGTYGLWMIKSPTDSYSYGYCLYVVRAAKKLGLSSSNDINDPELPTSGCFRVHLTVDRSGNRHSTFRAFLPKEYALDHAQNIHVCTNTLVRKVEMTSAENGRLEATGATLQSNDGTRAGQRPVYVKEVILCCGPHRTPQVLMLSGVGPADHLKDLGIPVIRDMSGVGSTLQDHIGTHFDFHCPMNHSLLALLKSFRMLIIQLWHYFIHGTGWLITPLVQLCILTQASLITEAANVRPLTAQETDSSLPENVPDIEIMVSAITDFRFPEFDKSKGVFQFLDTLLHPLSMGTVRLQSSDPLDQPLCTMQYLTRPEDWEVLRKAIRLSLQIAEEMRIDGYAVEPVHVPTALDDASIDAFIRKWTESYFHFSSSCRMAAENDSKGPGVVDDELRVHGVDNLRICDSSIFPQVPASHPQAAVVVVAEKCADMIKTADRKL